MDEEDLHCHELLSRESSPLEKTPDRSPRTQWRAVRSTVPCSDDVDAVNNPQFQIKCEKPSDTHVQQRLIMEFLAARALR